MMVGKRRPGEHRLLVRQLGLLLAIPLIAMTSSYALFSQQLSVNATSSSVAYVSNQYTTVTYTKATTGAGPYTYTFNPTVIKNNGVTSITAWQVTFNLPPGMTALTCPATVVCTQNATTVTITNGAANGTIASGGTTSFSFSFSSTAANYTLQNVNISATFSAAFQTVSGLTVTTSEGTRTKSGKNYYWPVTITVNNNSGQSMSAWQVIVPWNSTKDFVSSMPSGVTYTTNTTQLIITSTAALANGASYQFIPTIGSTNSAWTSAGSTVMGKA